LEERGESEIRINLAYPDGKNPKVFILPDAPAERKDPIPWVVSCWKECKEAGLNDGEAKYRIWRKKFRSFTKKQIAYLSQKLPEYGRTIL
jgi:hypothetical protein